jgi:hypothetical protein
MRAGNTRQIYDASEWATTAGHFSWSLDRKKNRLRAVEFLVWSSHPCNILWCSENWGCTCTYRIGRCYESDVGYKVFSRSHGWRISTEVFWCLTNQKKRRLSDGLWILFTSSLSLRSWAKIQEPWLIKSCHYKFIAQLRWTRKASGSLVVFIYCFQIAWLNSSCVGIDKNYESYIT